MQRRRSTTTAAWHDIAYRMLSRWQKRKLPEVLPIHLHRGRVYILPTRFGVFFGFFLIVILLGALNYNNNMALLLTFLLGALALLSPLHTVRNLAGLGVVDVTANPVFAGQNAQFELTLTNTSSTLRPMIWAHLHGAPSFVSIAGNERGELWVERATQRRGWLSMGRCRIYTHYPIGLFYAWCWIEPNVRCLVYPHPEDRAPPLPSGQGHAAGQPEQRGDEDWAGLRGYQAGDPSRLIAWKVVARTDQLVTKTFTDHESEELRLDYTSIPLADPEARIARLTRWVLEAHHQGLRYALNLPTHIIGPGSGASHRHQCLRALAEYPN